MPDKAGKRKRVRDERLASGGRGSACRAVSLSESLTHMQRTSQDGTERISRNRASVSKVGALFSVAYWLDGHKDIGRSFPFFFSFVR